MNPQNKDTHLFSTNSTPLCYSKNNNTIAIAQQASILLVDKERLTKQQISNNSHDKTHCLRLTDKLLVRGGNKGTLNMWDCRQLNNGPIHSLDRPGTKFTAVDVSQHILAAGSMKKISFFDLRKMKQKAQFTDSFNQEVLDIRFSQNNPAVFYACSIDGLISKFDLSLKDEEEASLWGYKMVESPYKINLNNQLLLVETFNQVLLTIEEGQMKKRFEINSIQNPTHTLASFLSKDNEVCYFTKQMRSNIVNLWVQNSKIAYLPTMVDVSMLIPLNKTKLIFSDSLGNWSYNEMRNGVSGNSKKDINYSFATVQQLQGKIQRQSKCGFILNKPSSLKDKTKKFKPV